MWRDKPIYSVFANVMYVSSSNVAYLAMPSFTFIKCTCQQYCSLKRDGLAYIQLTSCVWELLLAHTITLAVIKRRVYSEFCPFQSGTKQVTQTPFTPGI